MRRAERQVTDIITVRSIVEKCKVMRIGVQDEKGLYIVPVNFGYEMKEDGGLKLYLHSAPEGRKAAALSSGREVAVEMDCSHELVRAERPCNFSYLYQSVIGTGRPRLIEDTEEKKKYFNLIMLHQEGKTFEFSDEMVEHVALFEIELQDYSAKQHV